MSKTKKSATTKKQTLTRKMVREVLRTGDVRLSRAQHRMVATMVWNAWSQLQDAKKEVKKPKKVLVEEFGETLDELENVPKLKVEGGADPFTKALHESIARAQTRGSATVACRDPENCRKDGAYQCGCRNSTYVVKADENEGVPTNGASE